MRAQLTGLALAAISLIIPMQASALPVEAIPEEYSTIMTVVNRLAANNNLGSRPLLFTVVSGAAAVVLAESMGLCSRENCDYYGQLNPFKKYDRKTDEILRQAYLTGNIGSWAHSNGTIAISRETLRLYKGMDPHLACLLAHEISHVIDNHAFHQTMMATKDIQGKDADDQKRIYFAYGREFEKIADQKAYEMSIRSGWGKETCLDEIEFMHRITGDGSITDSASTHPGFEERWQALKQYAESEKAATSIQSGAGVTRGTWTFDPQLNVLIFQPSQH